MYTKKSINDFEKSLKKNILTNYWPISVPFTLDKNIFRIVTINYLGGLIYIEHCVYLMLVDERGTLLGSIILSKRISGRFSPS